MFSACRFLPLQYAVNTDQLYNFENIFRSKFHVGIPAPSIYSGTKGTPPLQKHHASKNCM
jgi:hypothetical protein